MQKKVSLSGFRDFLPKEARVRNYLKNKISQVFELFGFEPLETPALERAEVLLGKYGEEADKLLYLFEDRGRRKVGLRYDLTVPTARVLAFYANSQIKLPFKRYQIQDVFRAEKPQKGRYRQFLQCDVDIFGSKNVLSDAEILAVISRALEEVGLEKFVIRINSRKILLEALDKLGIEESQAQLAVLRVVDKLDKKGREGVEKELEEKGFSKNVLLEFEKLEPDEEIERIIELAENLGIEKVRISFDPFLVRGLDYYTGMIFEVVCQNFPSSIAGGGRYDNLVKALGGPDIPAVGGSLGFERIYEILKDKVSKQLEEGQGKVFVSVFSKELLQDSLQLVSKLRKEEIYCDFWLKDKYDLRQQLKQADEKGYRFVLILGPDEKKGGKVKIRDMRQRQEKLVDIQQVGKIIKEWE